MLIKRVLTSTLLSIALLASGAGFLAQADEARPQHWGQLISKEQNFHKMSDWVYRSEQPSSALLEHLKAHGIDTVINLRSRNKNPDILPADEFNLVHIPIHTWSLSREKLLSVMLALRAAKASGERVLIHCYHGSDRTGASIAMYRIIFENWPIAEAVKEMKQGGYGFHPIWVNIEPIFTEENVQWIRQQMDNSSPVQQVNAAP